MVWRGIWAERCRSSVLQVRTGSGEFEGSASPSGSPPKPEPMNGFALLPNMSSPPWSRSERDPRNADPPAERRSPTLPNGMGEGCEEGEGEEGEEGEEGAGRCLSLQALLKKSRAYLEREQGRRGGRWGGGRGVPPQPESLSDKENESSAGERGAERPSHATPPRRPPDLSPPGSPLGSVPRSLTGSYARLPSPEPSLSPRRHRRRPRPVSAGNILISRPTCAAQLSPEGGREGGEPGATAQEANPGGTSPNRGPAAADSPPPPAVGLRNSGQSVRLLCDPATPVSTSAPGPAAPDPAPPDFRRRSYTLDSAVLPAQSGPRSDRSQDRTPRCLGILSQRAASRRSPPAPLNQSYDVESPSPTLQRPRVTSDSAHSLVKHHSELEGAPEGGAMLSPLTLSLREQSRTAGQ